MNKSDVIVIGAGAVGSARAYFLARAGKKVTVLEKKDSCMGTGGATGGLLSWFTKKPGYHRELFLRSKVLFPQLAEELEGDIGLQYDVGTLQIIENELEYDLVKQSMLREDIPQGFHLEMLDHKQLHEYEPYMADDLTDAAPAAAFIHLDATTVLSRSIAELGIYPAVDPLASTSRALDPSIVGEEHYAVATGVQEILQAYNDLQDIIAILGMDELSEEQKLTVSRARKVQKFLGQPFHVATQFTGLPGKYVKTEDTIRSFKMILDGELDEVPEQAFQNKGAIEEVLEAAKELA